MTTTSPSQPTIESVWLVECRYAPDGADTRTPFRSEHIRVAAERIVDGRYVEVGAFADVSASIIIVRAGSEAEAVTLVSDDVYMHNGVWVEVRARPFGRIRLGDGA